MGRSGVASRVRGGPRGAVQAPVYGAGKYAASATSVCSSRPATSRIPLVISSKKARRAGEERQRGSENRRRVGFLRFRHCQRKSTLRRIDGWRRVIAMLSQHLTVSM